MKKDYAKNSVRKERTSANAASGWKSLVIGIVLGLIAAAGFYQYQFGPLKSYLNDYYHQFISKNKEVPKKQLAQATKTHTEEAPPQFSFYTVLSQGQQAEQLPAEHTAEIKPQTDLAPPPKTTITVASATTTQAPTTTTKNLEQNAVATNKANSDKPVIKNTKVSPKRYLLQIASFHSVNEADRLRAELTLMGFQVSVIQSNATTQAWFRVVLGPYHSLQAAQSDQQKLKQNHVSAILKPFQA
jgi:cell division protein FtsN